MAIFGSKRNDDLTGTSAPEAIYGGRNTRQGSDEGLDVLVGLGGADSLFGFGGNDLLQGNTGADVLDGGKESDVLIDGTLTIVDPSVTLRGILESIDPLATLNGLIASGAISPVADRVADSLFGGLGDDTLLSLGGLDTVDGGGGQDIVVLFRDLVPGNFSMNFGNGTTTLSDGTVLRNLEAVQIVTGAGNDTLIAGRGDDVLRSGAGDDVLDGGDADDLLVAGDGADAVVGGEGADTISGDAGFDLIDGGAGNDLISGGADGARVTGGAGRDTFQFTTTDRTLTVTDFNADGNDTLLLSGFGNEFNGSQEILAVSRQDGANTLIEIPDGSGGAYVITLENVLVSSLRGSDFLFA